MKAVVLIKQVPEAPSIQGEPGAPGKVVADSRNVTNPYDLFAIEEGLRWEPPLLSIVRTATRDTEVCGTPVPEGSTVVVNLGSANRDETRWDDPDSFDIRRARRPHLAFAHGPHLCLGLHDPGRRLRRQGGGADLHHDAVADTHVGPPPGRSGAVEVGAA